MDLFDQALCLLASPILLCAQICDLLDELLFLNIGGGLIYDLLVHRLVCKLG